MQDDRGWDKIVDAIDVRFGIDKHGRFTEPLEDRADLERHVAFIEFEKSGEPYRLERVASPAILDRKTHYHKAAGSDVRYENVYDPDDISFKTNLYHKNGTEWELVDPSELQL
jgi:hypothetical protein